MYNNYNDVFIIENSVETSLTIILIIATVCLVI